MKELSMRELCLSDKTGHIQGGMAVESYVFSIPLTLQTVQVYIKAALAAAFWSCPCFFFCPACFLAFFC